MTLLSWKFTPAWAFALAFALPGCFARAADNPDDYPRRLDLQTEGKATWYRLEIPMSVQGSAAHADLRDLRIFNAEGEALPHALIAGAERHTQTRREAQARLFPLYADTAAPTASHEPGLRVRRDNNGVIIEILPEGNPQTQQPQTRYGWLLDISQMDFPPERLRLDWRDAPEGFQRFSIEASDDLTRWNNWGEGQIVRLSFNGEIIDQSEVRLPGRKTRYLRLLWPSSQTAVALNKAHVSGTLAGYEPAPLIWSDPLSGQRIDTKTGESEFIWNLPLELPLERLRVTIPQTGTLAPVTVSGRTQKTRQEEPHPTARAQQTPDIKRLLGHRHSADDNRPPREAPWQLLTRGVLYRLVEEGRETAEEELELPGHAVNQLRLQFDSRGGGLGREIPELRVALHGYQLIFLARGGEPYQLAFGRAEAPSAALPLNTLIPGYNNRQPPAFGIARINDASSPSSPRTVTPPAAPEKTGDNRKTIGLWVVLLAGVALLAGMALSLLRSSKKSDETEH
jgi:hypothetical protein